MPAWMTPGIDALWRNAIAVVPLALLVAVICRFAVRRPATRHALWLVVLLWFMAPPILPAARLPANEEAIARAQDRRNREQRLARSRERAIAKWAAAMSWRGRPGVMTVAVSDAETLTTPRPTSGHERSWPSSEERDEATAKTDDAPALSDPGAEQAPTPPWTAARPVPSGPERLAPDAEPGGRLFALAESIVENLTRPARDVAIGLYREFGAADVDLAKSRDSIPTTCSGHVTRPLTTVEASPELTPFTPAPVTAMSPEAMSAKRPLNMELSVSTLARQQGARKLSSTAFAQPGIPEGNNSSQSLAPPIPAGQFQQWIGAMLNIRDAVGRLPTLPSSLWLLGTITLVGALAFRIIRFAGRLRAAWPAPPSVQRMVDRAAGSMGLRRRPETFIVRSRISPMVWCGLRPRLFLPRALWSQLDEAGREAVILHELAHLRRRDHWVRWLELIVSTLYWWHPLVWWVRHRINEEADLCCDAWVTWLLPRGRRDYAQALLATTQFVSGGPRRVPVVAMGVTSVHAKRFARRLTMVMTHSNKPATSIQAIGIAIALAAAGWIATPAESSPPAKSDQASRTGQTSAVDGTTSAAAKTFLRNAIENHDGVDYLAAVNAAHAAAPDDQTVTAYQMLAGQSVAAANPSLPLAVIAAYGQNGPGDVQQRLERLERQNAELQERLEQIMRSLERVGASNAPGQPDRPPTARGAGGGLFRTQPGAPSPSASTAAPTPRSPRPAAGGVGASSPRAFPSPDGAEIVRAYKLTPQKVDAICKLLLRDDVPIRVRQLPDAVEVHGSEANHAAFKAFADMIDSGWVERNYRMPEGKMEAFIEFMSLDDVPILVMPGGETIGVRATAPQQEVVQAFLDMIDPEGKPHGDQSRPFRTTTLSSSVTPSVDAKWLDALAAEKQMAERAAQQRKAAGMARTAAEKREMETRERARQHEVEAEAARVAREAAAKAEDAALTNEEKASSRMH